MNPAHAAALGRRRVDADMAIQRDVAVPGLRVVADAGGQTVQRPAQASLQPGMNRCELGAHEPEQLMEESLRHMVVDELAPDPGEGLRILQYSQRANVMAGVRPGGSVCCRPLQLENRLIRRIGVSQLGKQVRRQTLRHDCVDIGLAADIRTRKTAQDAVFRHASS